MRTFLSSKVIALKWFTSTNLAALTAIALSANEYYTVAFLSLCLALFISSFVLRYLWGSWINLSLLFLVAFILYTVSGPFEVLFGSGELPPFQPPFHFQEWFIDASFALIGFTWSMLLFRFTCQLRQNPMIRSVEYAQIALLLMLLASGGEITNLVRAGGLATLLAGKAVYQAKTTEITLTIPASHFALLAFAFIGMHYSLQRTQSYTRDRLQRFTILLFVFVSSPLLLVHLILGQRLEIACYTAAFILGYTYTIQVQRLHVKVIFGLLLAYFVFSGLFSFRWVLPIWLSGKTIDLPADTARRLFLSSLNPAVNEFGSPFGNYSTMMQSRITELHYGSTFLRNLSVAIPGFLYPGEKPVSTTYEFRNRFFAEWSQTSEISGTAFSNLLDARMNFGALGAPIVFFGIGSLLAGLEILRNRYSSPWFAAFYCSFGQFALVVHRSEVGGTLGGYLWILVILILVWCGRQAWKSCYPKLALPSC